nr:unnamed protein product [Digitaria exilis]
MRDRLGVRVHLLAAAEAVADEDGDRAARHSGTRFSTSSPCLVWRLYWNDERHQSSPCPIWRLYWNSTTSGTRLSSGTAVRSQNIRRAKGSF